MRIRLPKIREIGEALRSFFSRPYTIRYPFVPVVPPDGFRGKPEYSEKDCVGCLACFEVCPARAITYVDDKEKQTRTLTHRPEVCIYCQQCEKACITEKGITLTKQFELAAFNRRANYSKSCKVLVTCEHCGETIGCKDHLVFLAKKLGSLSFTNPNLILSRTLSAAIVSPHPRSGHLKILCPACRREMILQEQW